MSPSVRGAGLLAILTCGMLALPAFGQDGAADPSCPSEPVGTAVEPAASASPAATAGPAGACARIQEAEVSAGPLVEAFPESVGGKALEAHAIPSEQVRQMLGAEAWVLERVTDALGSQGLSIGDLEVAYAAGSGFQLVAYRVPGADASFFVAPFVDGFIASGGGAGAGDAVLGGGDAVVLTRSGQAIGALTARADILWLVVGDEPAIEEVVTALG